MRNELEKLRLTDGLACHDARKVLRHREPPAVRLNGGELCQRAEPEPSDKLPEAAERTGKERRARRAHRPDARAYREVQHDVDDAGQRVHMLMAVHMRDGHARRLDLPELCSEFPAHLFEVDAALQVAPQKRCVVGQEASILRHERRDL